MNKPKNNRTQGIEKRWMVGDLIITMDGCDSYNLSCTAYTCINHTHIIASFHVLSLISNKKGIILSTVLLYIN